MREPDPVLYAPRARAENVALIRAVVQAPSEEAFDEARVRFAERLHPSLFSELDWFEASVPPASRPGARRHVDGLFFENLAPILAQRSAAWPNDAELDADVAANVEFYRFVLGDPETAGALGAERSARIAEITAALPAERGSAEWPEEGDDRGARDAPLRSALDAVGDRNRLPLLATVAVQNDVLHHLDHVPSRQRTKAWLRRRHDGWLPALPLDDLDEAAARQRLDAALSALGEDAAGERLPELARTVRVLRAFLAEADLDAVHGFDGDTNASVGQCGRCAMPFASEVVVSLDPTASWLCELGDERIVVPEFNVARCPRCGHRARSDTPMLFHAPSRSQVVYLLPTGGQRSEQEAIALYRPLIEHARQRYVSRLDPGAAARFVASVELLTYDVRDFLAAIQLGSDVQEWHAWLTVGLADGTGLVVDPTKKVIIALTPEELAEHRARTATAAGAPIGAPGTVGPSAARPDDAATETRWTDELSAARAAFGAGRLDEARDRFEQLVAERPGDAIARTNLATVYLKLGQRDRAREVLGVAGR